MPLPLANPAGLRPLTASTMNASAKGEVDGMDVTVPLGIPAPSVAEAAVPPAVTVAVLVAVVTTVVVRTVEVMTVWGGLLITIEFVPPMKLKIVEADSYTVLKNAGYS